MNIGTLVKSSKFVGDFARVFLLEEDYEYRK